MIAQDILGTWQTEPITDSSNGLSIVTRIEFKPEGTLLLNRFFYNNEATFAFVAAGNYSLVDDKLFMEFKYGGSFFLVGNQYQSIENNWLLFAGNYIDVYKISSAAKGYVKTLPCDMQVVHLTDDCLETSEWKLKRK